MNELGPVKWNINRGWLKTIAVCMIMVLILGTGTLTYGAETTDTYGVLLQTLKVVEGFNGDLMEQKEISRVEMITLMSRLYPDEFQKYSPPNQATFTDVKTTHWGYKYVEFAFSKGITTGKTSKVFGINDPVNYNQVSLFLMRFLDFDVSQIQYITAADQISQMYGLNLLLPTEGSQELVRGEVFELMVKSLLMDDLKGISIFIQDENERIAFADRCGVVINKPVAISQVGLVYTVYYAVGDIYTGGFDGKMKQGNGLLKLANGDYYIGQFNDDKLHGYGIFVWIEGDYYEGYWADEVFNGTGIYTYSDGTYQRGDWVDNKLVNISDQLTPEDLKSGLFEKIDPYVIIFVDESGNPLKGIPITVENQIESVSYALLTDEKGAIEVPKKSELSLFSLMLAENSAYRFKITLTNYMVTSAGPYHKSIEFKLIRK